MFIGNKNILDKKLKIKKFNKIQKHKRVRFKLKFNNYILFYVIICVLNMLIIHVKCNRPPKFIIEGHSSEIVLRLKEGPETPVG